MRILLDAYFDNNFGDDLFIDLLLKRYPDALFYTFWRGNQQCVLKRAAAFPNLLILPRGCMMQHEWDYDAYVMIGGDVLPNGVDYSERINAMRHVKESGGYVAMLGFSLYSEYEEKTIADLKTMAEIADVIVIRDKVSAKRFQEFVPTADVIAGTDMVFTADFDQRAYGKENVLGIVPRRKLYSTDEEHWAYCRSMAQIADAYADKNSDAGVRFLAYSTGEYDDRQVALDIIGLMKNQHKAEVAAYEGDIDSFLAKVAACDAMVPTRFHGLVLALIFGIPFVPVPYEAKVTQLLEELNYGGIQIPYGKEITSEQVEETVEGLNVFDIAEKELLAYNTKKTLFFADLDCWMKEHQPKNIAINEMVCNICGEKERLQAENEFLHRQVAELEKWIRSLQKERAAFEEQNVDLDKKRVALEQQNVDLDKKRVALEQQNAELEQNRIELQKWIDSLKAERQRFERQNLELEAIRQWQAEKLQSLVLRPKKLEQEYHGYLESLQEKLDNQFS